MRPKITVTNVDRHGNVSDSWHVRVGNKWRTFNEAAWTAGGIGWINDQIKKVRGVK